MQNFYIEGTAAAPFSQTQWWGVPTIGRFGKARFGHEQHVLEADLVRSPGSPHYPASLLTRLSHRAPALQPTVGAQATAERVRDRDTRECACWRSTVARAPASDAAVACDRAATTAGHGQARERARRWRRLPKRIVAPAAERAVTVNAASAVVKALIRALRVAHGNALERPRRRGERCRACRAPTHDVTVRSHVQSEIRWQTHVPSGRTAHTPSMPSETLTNLPLG
jgi:hypothetical protein